MSNAIPAKTDDRAGASAAPARGRGRPRSAEAEQAIHHAPLRMLGTKGVAGTTIEDFFADAELNTHASLITGVVCGVRVEDIDDPLMQQIRYLDKLVDELAKGKAMDKILRK